MTALKTVSEIEAALRNTERVKAVMAEVDKGRKGKFTYVPWNETARLLTEIFGTFGWSAKIVGSTSDIERGVYVVDLELEVKATLDEIDFFIEKSLPGRGVGIAAANKDGVITGDAHDTAAKAARSDALSVAAKSLGDAFGLFLYDKGDPARTPADSTNGEQHAHQASTPATDTRAAAPSADGRVGFASEKQAAVMRKNDWKDEQIAALSKDEVKQVMDGLFGKGPKVAPPKTVQGGGRLQLVQPTGTADEF